MNELHHPKVITQASTRGRQKGVGQSDALERQGLLKQKRDSTRCWLHGQWEVTSLQGRQVCHPLNAGNGLRVTASKETGIPDTWPRGIHLSEPRHGVSRREHNLAVL